MPEHSYYEGLMALAALGQLTQAQHQELRHHLPACAECRDRARAYRELVLTGLPLTSDAKAEGIPLSGSLDARPARQPWTPGHIVAALASVAAIVLVAASMTQIAGGLVPREDPQALDQLRRDKSHLAGLLAARDQELAARQAQLQKLQGELASAARPASGTPQADLPGLRLGQSTSLEARLLQELQSREQQLASASEELARINQLRVTDRAALETQRVRLGEVFNQLRVATATIEMERQLASAGKDILELMLAKQLRVVDVRDTDENGRPGAAFARVFITEGRAIRIFAFDLNEGVNGAPRRLQVWGEQLGEAKSVRSLGVLNVDDRTQNRWSLSVQDAAIVKDINSVFVTAATAANAAGPRMLYAFLGETTAR